MSAPPQPAGPSAPLSDVRTGISFARFAALLTTVLGVIGAIMCIAHIELGDGGYVRPLAGVGVAILGITFGLVALLLFLAGWAEAWLAARRLDAAARD